MKMKNLKARLVRLTSMSVKAQLIGLFGMLFAMLLVGTWIGLGGMSKANESARQIYQDQLVPLTDINALARNSLDNFIALSEAAFHKDDMAIVKQKLAEVAKSQAADAELVKKIGGASMTPVARKQWDAFSSARDSVTESMSEITEALNASEDGIDGLLYSDVLPNVAIMSAELNSLIALKIDGSRQQYESRTSPS